MLRASVIVAVIVGWSTPALAAPASQPASQPTSQPASQPASQPVSKKKPASKGDVERPDPRVDSIFGGSQDTPDTKPKAKSKSKSRDDAIFGGSDSGAGTGAGTGTGTEKRLLQRVLDQGNKLQIGGLLYLRLNMSFTDGDKLEDHPISMPNLLDVFLDARPNDRVRAFVRTRLLYTPTRGQTFIPGVDNTTDLTFQLNEMWLKFDIARHLYVTVGAQRVLWGTTRLWNPVDFINLSLRPVLSPFDNRNGVPMVKLHFPLEKLGWNFYAIGLLQDVTSLKDAAAVGRAEFVFSTVELGIIGAYRRGNDPRVGIDISAGIWDFEVLGELALRFHPDSPSEDLVSVRASGALQYTIKVFDDDMLLLGVEYFYNQLGSSRIDFAAIATGQQQFFYVGKHYGAAFVSLPRPGKLDNWTFTMSGVGNFSDRSFLGRLDVSYTFLTYITVQAFAAVHFGKVGELRIGDKLLPDIVPDANGNLVPRTFTIGTQAVDLGLWLLINL